MNYKILLLFFSIILIFSCDDEQAAGPGEADTYIKFFGSDHADIAYVSRQTADGGSVLLGTTEIDNEGTDVSKIKVIKTDKNGNQVWQKVYPEFKTDQSDYETSLTGRSIIVVDDGYIIVGDSIKSDASDTRGSSLFLMKINDNATDNTFQYSALDYGNITGIDMPYDLQGLDIIEDSEGNFRTISNVVDDGQIVGTLFNRVTPDLQIDMTCFYESDENFTLVKSLIENRNGEFVYGGTDKKANIDNPKLIVMPSCQKNPSNGADLLNSNPTNNFIANQVISTSAGYAMVGTKDTDTGNTDVFFALFSQNGAAKINSLKTYDSEKTHQGIGSNNAQGLAITNTNDGGYMIVGSTLQDTAGELDILMIKTDALGNISWTKVLGNANEEYATHVQQAADGGFLIFGNTEFGGIDTMVLVKTDKDGNVN